jgi:hypothetical protein
MRLFECEFVERMLRHSASTSLDAEKGGREMAHSGGGKVKKLTAHLMILTALVVFAFAPAAFADIISGTGGEGYRTCVTTELSSQTGFT